MLHRESFSGVKLPSNHLFSLMCVHMSVLVPVFVFALRLSDVCRWSC